MKRLALTGALLVLAFPAPADAAIRTHRAAAENIALNSVGPLLTNNSSNSIAQTWPCRRDGRRWRLCNVRLTGTELVCNLVLRVRERPSRGDWIAYARSIDCQEVV